MSGIFVGLGIYMVYKVMVPKQINAKPITPRFPKQSTKERI
jgi:hypothetical protein